MNKFYRFMNMTEDSVDLFISGEIVDDETQTLTKAFFGESLGTSPSDFIEQLKENDGKRINVCIDSYGGDVFAASSIYSALKEHKGGVVVKITGVAASAASVIAMAGDKVLMAKTAVLMIHNPSTCAYGDHNEMAKAMDVLATIKESIINAYEEKTGLPREEISDLMEKETWMTCDEAIDKKFCDGLIEDENTKNLVMNCIQNRMFVYNSLYGKKNANVEPKNTAEEGSPSQEPEPEPINEPVAEDTALAEEQENRYADLLLNE